MDNPLGTPFGFEGNRGSSNYNFSIRNIGTGNANTRVRLHLEVPASGGFPSAGRWESQLGDTTAATRYSKNAFWGYVAGTLDTMLVFENATTRLKNVATTASAANVFINSSTGDILRSTSSRRYKTDIRDLPDWAVNKFDELHPVIYRSKDAPYGRPYGGLIAEEVDSVGLGLFVEYGKDGQPESVMYSHLVALLIAKVQQQEKRIEALGARR